MRKVSLLSASALGSVAFLGLSIATPAAAQGGGSAQAAQPCDNLPEGSARDNCIASSRANTPNPATAAGSAAGADQAIVITGTRIRRPDLESTVPVAIVRGEDIYQQANTNVGEALNNLPQLRSTFAQQNPGLGIGIAGLNLLDLRGLGVQRTLVLVNGRRHVPSDLQNTASAVDINSIPTDLIERIDIVTGGNSAVYGSDAIAGVVNFVLKDHFDGFQIRGGDSIPEYGAGSSQYISVVAGRNFADGRGNIAVAAEYTNQDRLFGEEVPWLQTANGFVTTAIGPTRQTFEHDTHSTTISRFGLVPIFEAANPAAPCGTGLNGVPYNCNFLFTQGGALVPETGNQHLGTGPLGTFIGGNGDNSRGDHLLSVLPLNRHWDVNLIGHYDVADALTFFVEGKYSRTHTIGSNSGPAFDQGAGLTFGDPRADVRLDNPFLSPAARQTIANAIIASGFEPGLLGGNGPLTPADLAAINDGSFRFTDARNFTDLGIRDEDATRDTFRIVAGFRGNITPHLNYEVSGNYGRATEDIKILGNVNIQRLMLALDAGRNPATGQIQCRSQFDPASAFAETADVQDPSVAQAELAADIAACVPYNPFGAPNNTAAKNYIVSNSGDHGHLTQEDVTGFVNADTGGFFRLPGGPISAVLGAEWRRDDAFFIADPSVESGMTFLNALQTFNPPAEEVTEGFGELNIPILKNMPFFQSLSASGAARVSHYNKAYGSTGTVWAWNFGGEWAPIRDIRFRANYGKSIRAPNYTETDAPLVQNFAPGFSDPCGVNNINLASAPKRAANCQAALSAVFANPAANSAFQALAATNYSLEIRSGSNPLLKAETSYSLTVGAVLTPRFLPGLDVTVDYFDIDVKNVIAAASAQTIVDLCYDEGQFCNLFQRNGTGVGPNGEKPGEIIRGSLIQAGLNFAALRRRGIDVEVNYDHKLNPDTRLNLRAYYTHLLKDSDYTDPTHPTFQVVNLDQLGDPKDELVLNADLTWKRFTFGYGFHYIGKMLATAYSNVFPVNGNPPGDPNVLNILYYPPVMYHDVRLSVQLGSTATNRRGYEWFIGVHNITNKIPPLGATGTGSGSAIYDVMGRTYFSGFRVTF